MLGFGSADFAMRKQSIEAGRVAMLKLVPQLKAAIKDAVGRDKQVILFQNRRGYSPFLICGTCGFIPHCNNCDVTLTLHKYSNRMHCHYCGSSYPKFVTCPACGSVNWMEKNFGTEKIEEELENEFPEYKIARMDVDSVRGKTAHDSLIQLFEQHRMDISISRSSSIRRQSSTCGGRSSQQRRSTAGSMNRRR